MTTTRGGRAVVLNLFFAAGAAQAQVQIYGTMDVAAGQLANQNAGPATTGVTEVKGLHNGALQTSYIGFRGTEDLGGGLFAKFQFEHFLRVDTGQTGRFDASPATAADPFWSRSAWVGLGSRFGELRLGHNTNPLWVAMLQTNSFGSSSVFSPSFRQLFNGGTRGRSVIDTAMANSVAYVSPNWGGATAVAVLQAGEGRGSRYNYAGHVIWRGGPVMLGAALQSARHTPPPTVATTADQDIWLVGGSYNVGFANLFVQYTEVDNAVNKSKLPHAGFTVPLGAGGIRFSTGIDKNKVAATGATTRRTTTSLGYVYGFSKRTDVYAFAMTEKFPVVGAAQNRGESYVLGISHRF